MCVGGGFYVLVGEVQSKTRADAAAQNLKMARLIGKPFPPGWEEGTHFSTGTKDTAWYYTYIYIYIYIYIYNNKYM